MEDMINKIASLDLSRSEKVEILSLLDRCFQYIGSIKNPEVLTNEGNLPFHPHSLFLDIRSFIEGYNTK